MSTKISKRDLFSKHALSVGLGVYASALLPQRASADTPFTSFPFRATGAPTPRTMPDRLGEIKNVKDYGAVGNGVTDDTAAIQACFDAAFGSYYSPHGGWGATPGPLANKEVYFPAGHYNVSSSYTQNILSVKDSGTGNPYRWPLIEVASTAGLRTGDMIYVRGATPANINGSYGVDVVDSTHFILRMAQFTTVGGAGGTAATPCLKIHMVQGGHIFGAGRIATQIISRSPNCACLTLNGWGYSRMDALGISASTGGIGLDYNWCQRQGDTASSQSNTFSNMSIGGGDYGLTIGWGQAMCSENTWMNCYISGDKVGVLIQNYNALQNGFIGGNIAGCKEYGILVGSGAAPVIINMGFQNYEAAADIYVQNGAGDGYAVIGCRTESPNFFMCGPSMAYSLIGCVQLQTLFGVFYSGVGPANLIGCYSKAGTVKGGGGSPLNVLGCNFERADWNQWYGPTSKSAELPYYQSKTANYSCAIIDTGTVFDNTGATGEVQINLPMDTTELTPGVNAGRLPPGTKLKFLVTAAQSLKVKAQTGATIRMGSSVSTAGGYIRSNVVGSFLELMAIDKGGYKWVVVAREGTWTVDS